MRTLRKADDITRRDILTRIARTALGVSVVPFANELMNSVVLATEFGRTPAINPNSGRDHHPAAFACVLAGAGIKAGQVVGRTDTIGRNVEEGAVLPPDFNATIASACGLPVEKEFQSDTGRPLHIADDGKPIAAVLQTL